MKRAAETAEVISKYINLDVNFLSGLREHNYGIATDKTKEWLNSHISPIPQSDRLNHRPVDGAETWLEFYDRIKKALDEVAKTVNKAIIVTHGGALSNVIAWWLKIPVQYMEFSTFRGKVGGISKAYVDNNNFRVLGSLGDDYHLKELR